MVLRSLLLSLASLVCVATPVVAQETPAPPASAAPTEPRETIEGTLSQGVRAFGLRRSRYVGLARTSFQQACTGAAINILRAVRWLEGRPRAKTRVTRFAALALLAA